MSTRVRRDRQSYNGTAVSRTVAAVVDGFHRISRWAEMRSARRQLQTMSDGFLADMGVSRGSIEHATRFGRGTAGRR